MCFDIPSQWWTREEAAVTSRHRKENFSPNENSYLRPICKPNIYACLLIARERRGIRLMGINWYRESFPRRSPPAATEMRNVCLFILFIFLVTTHRSFFFPTPCCLNSESTQNTASLVSMHTPREGDTDKWLLLEIQSTLRYPRDSATRNLV